MVCCETRYVETERACDLCGLDMACGDRAYAQSDTDGTLSWVCAECWRELCDHFEDRRDLPGEYAYAGAEFDDWDAVGGL
jgi:hypothetical protein